MFRISLYLLVPVLSGLAVMVLLSLIGKVPISYNLRNLTVRWWTTLLTASAFTLVVGVLTIMLAFVNGMYRLTEGSGQPGNVMVLSDGATDELWSNLGHGDIANVERRQGILQDDKGVPLCSREVYLVINQEIPKRNEAPPSRSVVGLMFDLLLHGKYTAKKEGPSRRFVSLRGIETPSNAERVHNLPLLEGSWFSDAGVQPLPSQDGDKPSEQAIQAVLGEGLAREFGHDYKKPRLDIGDVFELGPRKWVVVGILKSAGSAFDSEVWAKRSLAGDTFGKKDLLTTLVVRTSDDNAKALAEDLSANFKESALAAQREVDYYSKLSENNLVFLIGILIIAAVMAVGGVFGVMNTMFAAISQRTNDIGVLRLLGFTGWQVLVSFLLESMVIALLGGLLGCALGSLANGWSANSIVSSGQGGKSVMLKLVVDANILAAGMLFTLIMGGLGGLFPALSAMRLRPLESLK